MTPRGGFSSSLGSTHDVCEDPVLLEADPAGAAWSGPPAAAAVMDEQQLQIHQPTGGGATGPAGLS